MQRKICIVLNFIPVAIICIFMSCSSGKSAFKKGNFYDACDKAISRLKSASGNKNALQTLREAYPLAINYTKQEAINLTQFYQQGNYLQLYRNYETMHNIARNITASPAALKMIPFPEAFNNELNKYRDLAANESYNIGVAALNVNTRESAKTAYYNFLQVQQLIPNYKDIDSKINDALWLATLKVMVDIAPVTGAYQLNADFFYSQVLNYVSGNFKDKFIRFYSPSDAQEYQINPDQVLQISFYDFVVGNVYENNSTYEVKRDSVKIGTSRDVNAKPIDVYGTVKAKITSHVRTIDSRGLLDVNIIDYASNRTIAGKRFSGAYAWVTSWGSFNGDERALSNQELAMCNARPQMPPPPQDLFIEFTKPLYTQVTNYLKSYYNNY